MLENDRNEMLAGDFLKTKIFCLFFWKYKIPTVFYKLCIRIKTFEPYSNFKNWFCLSFIFKIKISCFCASDVVFFVNTGLPTESLVEWMDTNIFLFSLRPMPSIFTKKTTKVCRLAWIIDNCNRLHICWIK